MKRIALFLLALCLGASSLAFAQVSEPWTGDTATSFAGGSGTEEDPYLITNGAELMYLSKETALKKNQNAFEGVYFRLENDIDLGGALAEPTEWNPIGNRPVWRFGGHFDGNGKKIKNIYINDPANAYGYGVFGNIGTKGCVENLVVESGSIEAKSNLGGIAGVNYGLISNCRNHVEVTSLSTASAFSLAGGIVGSNNGKVYRCVNYGNIVGNNRIGGITGYTKGMISECVQLGRIETGTESSYISSFGGLVGEVDGGVSVVNSVNYGTLDLNAYQGSSTGIAGLVGSVKNGGKIQACLMVGNIVTDNLDVAALLNVSMSGNTTAPSVYGDLQMTGCPSVSISGTVDGARMLPTDSMTQKEGLSGFSDTAWVFTEGAYPLLKSFENDETIKVASLVPVLSYTDTDTYDEYNAVRENFHLPVAYSAQWSKIEGESVTLEGSEVLVERPSDKSDTIRLRVKVGESERDYEMLVLMGALPLSVVKPENGSVKVFSGDKEYVDGDKVDDNTLLTLKAEPDAGFLLDYFTLNGVRIEEPSFTVTEACTVSAVFMADEDPAAWDGTIAEGFGAGTGSTTAPYQIRTPQQLAYLAQEVNKGNSFEGKYFQVIFNLDLGNQEWIPIGGSQSVDTVFSGVLDGMGKKISGLKVTDNRNAVAGLFGRVAEGSVAISNITVSDALIEIDNPDASVGILAGYSRAKIENCYVSGTISGTADLVGGMVGYGGLSITNSVSEVSIHVEANAAGGIVGNGFVLDVTGCQSIGDSIVNTGTGSSGGIVGSNNAGTVNSSYNESVVYSEGRAGGIAGVSLGSTFTPSIDACSNIGDVYGVEAGGLIGTSTGALSNSFNLGKVTGIAKAGGLMGSLNSNYAQLGECYSAGKVIVSGSGLAGGLIGEFTSGNISSMVYDIQMACGMNAYGNSTGGDEFGLLTSELTEQLPEGFDPENWTLEVGAYPIPSGWNLTDGLKVNMAAIRLHAYNDSVFDTPDHMQADALLYTGNGVTWKVEEGDALVLDGENLKVQPVEEESEVILSVSAGTAKKTYHLMVTPVKYTLVLKQNEGGRISAENTVGEIIPSGTELEPNDTIYLKYECEKGYMFKQWYDGSSEEVKELVVKENTTVWAEFEKAVYTIMAEAGEGGTITPSGETQVEYGESQTYTILPSDGYTADSIFVDGKGQAYQPTYTFSNVDADHTIRATFKIKQYLVKSSCGENGTISPLGDSLVDYGKSIAYTITPDEGYQVAKLVIDGVDYEADTKYTFQTVIAEHTIHAEFEKQTGIEDDPLGGMDVLTSKDGLVVRNNTGSQVKISIYGTNGIRYVSTEMFSGEEYHKDLCPGLYIIHMVSGNKSESVKVSLL